VEAVREAGFARHRLRIVGGRLAANAFARPSGDTGRMSAVLLAESFVHTLDPFVFEIAPGVGPRWYGLSYLAGFVVGWLVLRSIARRGLVPLGPQQVGDLLTWLVVGVLVGGRVGHVLFYDRPLLWTFDGSFPWWGLLAIHKGGMSSHGGVIGVAIACWLFARRHGWRMSDVSDPVVLAAGPGLGFGRLANLVNGELWGKALPDSMQANPPWWSIKYPEEVLDPDFVNAELLENLRPLADPLRPFPQSLHEAAYAGRDGVVEALTPLLTAYHPSQLYQAITDGVIIPLVLVAVWWKPRPSGTLTGAFFVAYGVLRMTTEQFRQPDVGVFTLGPVTLPMLLSLAMIAVGAAAILATRRAARIGGLSLDRGPFSSIASSPS
jgi:phosphatidylglycerol:prolipoprotein diacylglycerol transferase